MVNKNKESLVILIAEDDDDDFMLTQDAFREGHLANRLDRVKDGVELLEHLEEKAKAGDLPAIILLDLNMPKKDGREALKEIKAHPQFRRIPVVVLTTSQAQEDILRSYEMGVNSFIRKPVNFDDFIKAVQVFNQYWFKLVELPADV